jgi:hypothetical protein
LVQRKFNSLRWWVVVFLNSKRIRSDNMNENSLCKRISGLLGIFIVLAVVSATTGAAVAFQKGDVFAGVGPDGSGNPVGNIRHYDKNGIFIENLIVPDGGYTEAGMGFDSAGNLYSADFATNKVSKFKNDGTFVSFFGSGYGSNPESIAIDSLDNVYVGQADGTRKILGFDKLGNPLPGSPFTVATGPRGTDWVDLAANQKTMYYTSEGDTIRTFDVSTSTQGADFRTGLTGGVCYALRIMTNGDVMVACTSQIHRISADGTTILKTYANPGTDTLFALNLDPDGTSFWTGGLYAGKAYKIDIASGALLMTIDTTAQGRISALGGLAVFGEIRSSQPPGTDIPEFPSVALPIMSVLGIMFLMSRKRHN